MRELDPDRPITRSERIRLAMVLAALMAIATLATSCCLACTAPYPRPPGYSVAEREAAAVRIERICFTGNAFEKGGAVVTAGFGSGGIVGTYEVVTAAHVIDCSMGSPLISIVDLAGRRRVADIAAIDYVKDVAMLRVREPFSRARAPGYALPVVGQVICGYAAIPKREPVCGTVVALGDFRADWRVVDIEFKGPVKAGNSGSAMYDADGRVVGVITHSRDYMGLCAMTGDMNYCEGRGATLLGKLPLPQ